jgi:enoyl-CoA hydratase
MMASKFTCFTFDIAENNVAHVRLTRPEVANMFDPVAHGEFVQLLKDIWGRTDIRALVLSAEGKSFSAGGDMNMMLRQNNDRELRDSVAWEARAILEMLTDLSFPVIAAVQGNAIGLGATIATLSDIVVVYEGARIADPHVHLGLVAGDGGVLSWAQSVGLNRAKRYLLTGDPITGKQAYEMGLATDLVATPEEVTDAALAIANRIAALPKWGVMGTKRAFNKLSRTIGTPALELGLAYEMECMGGQEVFDTVTATMAAMKAKKAAK